MANEKQTPCGRYTYYSWGIYGSKSDRKIMYDNCKNHCEEKVCLLLKKKDRMYITANRITQNCISIGLQDKVCDPTFREFQGFTREDEEALIKIDILRDQGHIYIGNNKDKINRKEVREI